MSDKVTLTDAQRDALIEQFVEIQKSKDLLFLKPKIEDLKTNYRSQKEIIEFNNFCPFIKHNN